MLALTALFVTLGVWQLNRLDEKQAALALIEERAEQPPMAFPPVAEWVGLDPVVWNYRPVTLTGSYRHDLTVLVFTSLPATGRHYSGPGYWVMAPMQLTGGGSVWVNRGFVPNDIKDIFSDGGPVVDGETTITGIARVSERVGPFTPGSDKVERIEWVRTIDRLNQFLPADFGPVADVYVDRSAGVAGALPQGGETVLSLPNRHFEYALTWFAFAGITPIMLGFWLFSRRRNAVEADD